MAKAKLPFRRISGLNTTARAEGLSADEATILQNVLLERGVLERRPGVVRLDVAAADTKAMDFNGTNEYVTVGTTADSRVWSAGTKFTLRAILEPDTASGTQPLLKAGITTPAVEVTTSSSKLVVKVWDSGNTLTTITSAANIPTSTFSLFVTRDDDVLKAWIDDGTSSGEVLNSAGASNISATNSLRTPVGALEFARDGTNYYDGTIDSVEFFHEVLPATARRWRLHRWPDPFLYPSCVAAYHFDADANAIVKDLSRFRLHGYAQNTPTEVTALAYNPAALQVVRGYRSTDNKRKVLVIAGGVPYIVELT